MDNPLIGDRVMLKRWYAEVNGDMDRDKEFGPEAGLAIGTITNVVGNSVWVIWDDPSHIRDDWGEPSIQWSELWFDKVGRLDLSEPDKIEAFLNGR